MNGAESEAVKARLAGMCYDAKDTLIEDDYRDRDHAENGKPDVIKWLSDPAVPAEDKARLRVFYLWCHAAADQGLCDARGGMEVYHRLQAWITKPGSGIRTPSEEIPFDCLPQGAERIGLVSVDGVDHVYTAGLKKRAAGAMPAAE